MNMFKTLLESHRGLFSVLALSVALTACTSKDSTDEEGDGGEVSETNTDESADGTTAATTGGTTDGTTGGTTGGTTDGTTGDTSGSGFVASDTMMSCGTMCNIFSATNDCPDGEKCTSVACEIGSNAWDSNVCRPIMGDKQVGDDCDDNGSGLDGNDDCGEGLMCWDSDPDTGFGSCIAFCEGSQDNPTCADTNSLCAVANNGTLPICLPKCDPLAVSCPKSTDLCIPNPGEPGFVCVLDASGGMAPYGTPCNGPNEDDNSCNQGLICIPTDAVPESSCQGSPGCCSPLCDLGQPNNCPGTGQECIAWFNPPVPGYEDVGICTIPQ